MERVCFISKNNDKLIRICLCLLFSRVFHDLVRCFPVCCFPFVLHSQIIGKLASHQKCVFTMQTEHKKKLQELQQIISKMPLGVICMTVLPEFGVQWREVFRAVRNSRLPMVPASMARVLSKHAAKSLPLEEIAEIVSRLRLKLVATQERKWFVIDLQEPIHEEASIAHMTQTLPCRVANALKKGRGRINMQPENMEAAERPKLEDEIRTKQEEVFRIQEEVSAEDAETRRLQDGGEKARRKQIQAVLLGELLYMSVQLVSANKEGAVLYVATPPPYPVALVSSLNSSLLKACVEGLGYKKHEDAQLFGRDVLSLLRIHDTRHDENVRHLASLPEYNPVPVVTPSGIDFTNKTYDEKYIEEILGPNPPLLTDLEITSEKPFFDPSRLNKKISLKVQIKSEDIAKSLKTWVTKGALSPTSDYFQIFHKVKSNKITFQDDMED